MGIFIAMKRIHYILSLILLLTSSIGNAQVLTSEDIILESTRTYPDAAYDPNIYDDFGTDREMIGDVNGDGINDIAAIGRHSNKRGVLYILLMNADGTVNSHVEFPELSLGFSNHIYGYATSYLTSVASLGDIDGDGMPDLLLGMGTYFYYTKNWGGVSIVSLKRDTNNTITADVKSTYHDEQLYALNVASGGVLHGTSSWPRTGLKVEAIGDIDNDGVTDVAISSAGDANFGHTAGWPVRGRVYIARLNSNGTLKSAL